MSTASFSSEKGNSWLLSLYVVMRGSDLSQLDYDCPVSSSCLLGNNRLSSKPTHLLFYFLPPLTHTHTHTHNTHTTHIHTHTYTHTHTHTHTSPSCFLPVIRTKVFTILKVCLSLIPHLGHWLSNCVQQMGEGTVL